MSKKKEVEVKKEVELTKFQQSVSGIAKLLFTEDDTLAEEDGRDIILLSGRNENEDMYNMDTRMLTGDGRSIELMLVESGTNDVGFGKLLCRVTMNLITNNKVFDKYVQSLNKEVQEYAKAKESQASVEE